MKSRMGVSWKLIRLILSCGLLLGFLGRYGWPLNPNIPIHQLLLKTWSVDDGLPISLVLTLAQAKDGYLWIGTEVGGCLFDGNKFLDPAGQDQLNSVGIGIIKKFPDQSLWICTQDKRIYCRRDGRLELRARAPAAISDMCELKPGMILLGSASGFFRLENQQIESWKPAGSDIPFCIMSLFKDRQGKIWAGTFQDGLFLLEFSNGTWRVVEKFLPGNTIHAMCESADGAMYFGCENNGLFAFRRGKFSHWTVQDGLSGNTVRCLGADTHGSVWIGTQDGGLNRYRQGKFSSLTDQDGLPSNNIRSLLIDSQENIWLGTSSGGLCCLQEPSAVSLTTRDGLVSDQVTGVWSDSQDRLWIITENCGVQCLSSRPFILFDPRQKKTAPRITALAEGTDGTIWLGTARAGIYCSAPDRPLQHHQPPGLANQVITALYPGNQAGIWIGTAAGQLWSGAGQQFQRRFDFNKEILALHDAPGAACWVSLRGGGLARFKDDGTEIFSSKKGLPPFDISCITSDREPSSLWLSTLGGGIVWFSQGRFLVFNQERNFPEDTVYSLLFDGRDHIWASTPHGVISFKINDANDSRSALRYFLQPQLFGINEGLKNSQCRGDFYPAGSITRAGDVYFPTHSGIARIKPGEIPRNSQPPPVLIEKILLDNKELPDTVSVHLQDRKGMLEICYTAVEFIRPADVTFRYRLDPFDRDWIDAGSRRNVFYTNLPAGAYRWQLIAANGSGVWNTTGTSLELVIDRSFIESFWFYLTGFLILMAIISLIIHFRIRHTKKRESELQEIIDQRYQELLQNNTELSNANRLKSRLLNMLTHDLNVPLAVIHEKATGLKSAGEFEQKIAHKLDFIIEASRQMSALVHDLLDSDMVDSGKLKLKMARINISDLAALVAEANRPNAELKRQRIVSEIEPSIYIIGDKGRIREVFDNLLSNAMKFSLLDTTIWLRIKKRENMAEVEIQDEGPGFSPQDREKIFGKFQLLSAKPTGGEPSIGLGLAIVKSLVELHGGKVWVESPDNQKGCLFKLQLSLAAEGQRKSYLWELPADSLNSIEHYDQHLEIIYREWRRAIRHRITIAAIIADIDYFKVFQDIHGPNFADETVDKISQLIRVILRRPGDLVARFGTEEFILILADASRKGVLKIADKIRKRIMDLKIENPQSPINKYLTASFGCSVIRPDRTDEYQALLRSAQRALDLSKERGRNCVTIVDLTARK